jgi:hypothetical protein
MAFATCHSQPSPVIKPQPIHPSFLAVDSKLIAFFSRINVPNAFSVQSKAFRLLPALMPSVFRFQINSLFVLLMRLYLWQIDHLY